MTSDEDAVGEMAGLFRGVVGGCCRSPGGPCPGASAEEGGPVAATARRLSGAGGHRAGGAGGLPQGHHRPADARRAGPPLRRSGLRGALPDARAARPRPGATGVGHAAAVRRGASRPPGRRGGAGPDRPGVRALPGVGRPRLRPRSAVRVPRAAVGGRAGGAALRPAGGALPGGGAGPGARAAAHRRDPGAGGDPDPQPAGVGRRGAAPRAARARGGGAGLAARAVPARVGRPLWPTAGRLPPAARPRGPPGAGAPDRRGRAAALAGGVVVDGPGLAARGSGGRDAAAGLGAARPRPGR